MHPPDPGSDKSLHFRTSSFCSDCGCVEVGLGRDSVVVRDSKLTGGSPSLTFTHDEWVAFVAGVKNGEFDLG